MGMQLEIQMKIQKKLNGNPVKKKHNKDTNKRPMETIIEVVITDKLVLQRKLLPVVQRQMLLVVQRRLLSVLLQ